MNQIGNVVVTDTKRRLLVGCLTLLVGVPIMACCLILLGTVVFPGLDSMAAGDNADMLSYILPLVGVLFLFMIIVIPVGVFLFITRNRAKMLDSIFQPLGLQGEMYMLVGRHYWGAIDGRSLDVYIYRGPTMEIHLSSQSQTRIQILPTVSMPVKISGVFNKHPMENLNPQLSKYAIYAEDESWAQALLSDIAVITALQSLMFEHADWAIFRHVEIQPNEVLLYLYRSKQLFTKRDQFKTVQAWMKALQTVADAIDSQPAPAKKTLPAKDTSRQARQKKSKYLNYALIAILIGMPLCMIGIGILAYLLVSL